MNILIHEMCFSPESTIVLCYFIKCFSSRITNAETQNMSQIVLAIRRASGYLENKSSKCKACVNSVHYKFSPRSNDLRLLISSSKEMTSRLASCCTRFSRWTVPISDKIEDDFDFRCTRSFFAPKILIRYRLQFNIIQAWLPIIGFVRKGEDNLPDVVTYMMMLLYSEEQ